MTLHLSERERELQESDSRWFALRGDWSGGRDGYVRPERYNEIRDLIVHGRKRLAKKGGK